MTSTDGVADTPWVIEILADHVNPRNFIDGQWRDAESANVIAVTDPATDRIIAWVPDGNANDANNAVAAATRALPTWQATSGSEKALLLRRLFDLIEQNAGELARIITMEEGKPLAESRGEVAYAAGFVEWAAEEAKRVHGESILSTDTSKRLSFIRQGVGVTAAVTPWNFPLAMVTRKLAPALAAGCTQVIKPAPETPLTAMALCLLAEQAGFPDGVINLVTGSAPEIVGAWLVDPAVRKLSFTGSTPVGKLLIAQSATNVTRLSLELGGHAPLIVFDDADIESSAAEAARGKFRNSGQSCISPNRFYVADAVYDEFVERFVEITKTLSVGSGKDAGVDIGPLISDRAVAKARAHVSDALSRGGNLLVGGDTVELGGDFTDRFFSPTVLVGDLDGSLITREETFAPIAPIMRFDDEADVIRRANDSEYGLAAYFFSRDVGRISRVAESLDYGIVGVNDAVPSTAQAPFGGVKQSGLGREGGRLVMDEYTEVKFMSVQL